MRVLFAVLAFVLFAGDASARVQLKRSYPAHGATVMFREPEVQLEFSEAITAATVAVIDFKDRTISIDKPEIGGDDNFVTVQIRSPNPPRPFEGGDYVVRWRVISKATGEVSEDSFTFHIHAHP